MSSSRQHVRYCVLSHYCCTYSHGWGSNPFSVSLLPYILDFLSSCILFSVIGNAKNDDVQDSGIEASGETEPNSERDALPETIQSKTPMKSESMFLGELHDSKPEMTIELPESDQVPCQNGTLIEPDLHLDSDANELIEVEEKEDSRRWSFPPVLDEFDLMVTDKDPSELEDIFSDDRYVFYTPFHQAHVT